MDTVVEPVSVNPEVQLKPEPVSLNLRIPDRQELPLEPLLLPLLQLLPRVSRLVSSVEVGMATSTEGPPVFLRPAGTTNDPTLDRSAGTLLLRLLSTNSVQVERSADLEEDRCRRRRLPGRITFEMLRVGVGQVSEDLGVDKLLQVGLPARR